MDTTCSTNRKSRKIFASLMSILAVVAIAFPATQVASAGLDSPFLGQWQATDVDESEMHLTIAGRPTGPFQITWTDQYISFCSGEAGIVRGTGWLNDENSDMLESDIQLECFATGATLDFHVTFLYHPATNTLSVKWSFGQVTIWYRPGRPQARPPTLNLRVSYGHEWADSF